MRHLKKGRKFGRRKGQRKAFFKTLSHNLIMSEKLNITEARAKELKPKVERLLTHAKKQNLAGLRFLIKQLPKQSAYKLYHEIAPRYQKRPGGYLRIVKNFKLRTDGAPLANIEFVK